MAALQAASRAPPRTTPVDAHENFSGVNPSLPRATTVRYPVSKPARAARNPIKTGSPPAGTPSNFFGAIWIMAVEIKVYTQPL
jgi:hypothetical protein